MMGLEIKIGMLSKHKANKDDVEYVRSQCENEYLSKYNFSFFEDEMRK